MICDDIKRKIALYHAAELDDGERRLVEQHIDACPSCADFAGRVSVMLTMERRRTEGGTTVDILSRVNTRLDAARSFPLSWILAPVAGLLIGGLAAVALDRRPEPGVPPADFEVVRHMEFLNDYDLCADLDAIETAAPAPRES